MSNRTISSKQQSCTDLSERAEKVLCRLIESYVREGSPIGSKYLSNDSGIGLSAATIRNVMHDLEEMGLIQAPHTSAGRVPTAKGYRVFVDSTIYVEPIRHENIKQITESLQSDIDPNSILKKASGLLSNITSFAGMVSIPSQDFVRLKQIEFLPLSESRVLAILVTDDGRVQNKVLKPERHYSDSELVAAANFFNEQYSSKALKEVKQHLISLLKQAREQTHIEMQTALSIAQQILVDNEDEDNVLVSGMHNLISIPEFQMLDTIKNLLDSMKTKQLLYDLLQKSMVNEGVNIFIGEESGYDLLRECSIIAAPYEIDSHRVGVLGVIGPTRMEYNEVISTVDITARILSSILSGR